MPPLRLLLLVALGTGVVAVGCVDRAGRRGPIPPVEGGPERPPVDRLAPGDVIEVRVFRENELNGTYAIALDGTIVFPLIGRVEVAGREPQAAADLIREQLEDGYLREAFVTLLVRQRTSLNVHVMGQVSKSGTFEFRPGMTVIEAITKAGGFTRMSAKNSVRVTRTVGDREQVFQLRVGDIGDGRAPNFELEPGDIVNVPEALF